MIPVLYEVRTCPAHGPYRANVGCLDCRALEAARELRDRVRGVLFLPPERDPKEAA